MSGTTEGSEAASLLAVSAVREHLPATFLQIGDGQVHRPQDNMPIFLKRELTVPKLNKVQDYLWWAAGPAPARALHEFPMEKRLITATEDVHLHLMCPSGRVFIKPLPAYLLHHDFWVQYLSRDAEVYGCALGFLLSYIWIIRHESDLEVAKNAYLVPTGLEWKAWVNMTDSIVDFLNGPPARYHLVNKRYLHGEISLSSLNTIYRYVPETDGFGLYVTGYGQLDAFFERNFAWMGLGFLYLVAILTAMQVSLAAGHFKDNDGFNWASGGFAIFCILLSGIILGAPFLRHVIYLVWFSIGRARRP